MGDSNTSLINTRIALSDAPDAALGLYRRLTETGAIEPQPRDDVPFSLGLVFPVRAGYAEFDAAIEPIYRPRIYGVDIEVTGRSWRNSSDGFARLEPSENSGNGLFFNVEGGFDMTCPACGHTMLITENDHQVINEALSAWCAEWETASLRCSVCERQAPVRDWRSANHWFAAGHLAFTLWGAHVMSLVEKPTLPAATALRRLVGDLNDDYAVVFCHI